MEDKAINKIIEERDELQRRLIVANQKLHDQRIIIIDLDSRYDILRKKIQLLMYPKHMTN